MIFTRVTLYKIGETIWHHVLGASSPHSLTTLVRRSMVARSAYELCMTEMGNT